MNGQRLISFFYLFTLVILLCFHFSTAKEDGAEELDEDELAVRRWRETFGRVKKLVGDGIKIAMPYFMSSMYDKDLHVSQECRSALFQWIADMKAVKPWALRMFDASAKDINGLLTGSLAAYGSFDQCLDIVNPKRKIKGKYCTIEMRPRLPPKPRFYSINQRLETFKQFENDTGVMGEFTKSVQLFYNFPLRLGACVPSPCSEADISNITSQVAKNFFTLNLKVPRCQVREPTVIENYQIPILCVIAVLALFVTVGTSYHVLIYKKQNSQSRKGVLSECLMAFSAVENWKKLMDLEAGAEDLSVLQGMRVISMCWIILGHTYFHLNFNILTYLQVTLELTSQFIFNTITNATLVVDNFFFFSGLLLVYVTMDMVKVVGKIPRFAYFIIHRFWRFLPIQMFFVGCSTLLPLFGDGPTWHENVDPIVEGCKKEWWANMLFINNLYRTTEKGCLSYSWYLAADFQIYIFCIPVVMLVIRKPRIGLWVTFVLMMLSAIAVGVHTYVRDLPPTMLFTRIDVEQRTALMKETYYTPYQHLGPFCIGIFVGYFFQTHKGPIKIHWSLNVAAWLGTFGMTFAALYGVHPWNKGYGATGVIPTILYASLSRMAWTLGIAWITVACTKGCGGIAAKILRNKIFIPFSRLTFLVYMIHPLVQLTYYSTLRNGIQAMNQLAIFTCFGFIVSSYGIAFVLSMLLESPFINLGKIIFRRREEYKKGSKGSLTNSSDEGQTTKPPSNWKTGPIPSLAKDYGKCNGAYDYRTERIGENNVRTSLETTEVLRGDFICHL